MPVPMPEEPIATLRQVNRNLRSVLIRFRPEMRVSSAITSDDFRELLNEVARAGQCLQQPASALTSAEFETESFECRNILEALKKFLPDVQVRLLAEKSRLEVARSQLLAAEAWALARKKEL
jgi:hypothetical protein